MRLIRYICVAYWVVLTVLLLVPDPSALLGLRRIPGDREGLCAHFAVFAILGALVQASRLRLRPALLGGVLLGYAVVSELLQSVVGRDTSLWDLLADLFGVAAGTAVWWVAERHISQRPNRQE
jgi:VanZ family protein